MKLDYTDMPYGCGLGVMGYFFDKAIEDVEDYDRKEAYYYGKWPSGCDLTMYEPNATGYFVAAFIENETCVEAERQLREKFTVMFESEWRINTNSGNNFKFIVFDNESEK